MEDGKLRDPGPGHVILFEFRGRQGGEKFSNPLPSNAKASITSVCVGSDLTGSDTTCAQLIYDPDSQFEKIEGIDDLKSRIEYQSLELKA